MKNALLFIFFVCFFSKMNAQRSAELLIFPNPTTEFITLQDAQEQVCEIWIFNLLGKRVKTFQAEKEMQHFVGDLPKNIYILQLVSREQKIITTQKLQKR